MGGLAADASRAAGRGALEEAGVEGHRVAHGEELPGAAGQDGGRAL